MEGLTTTMKLSSSLHRWVNIEKILITLLCKNMKERKREHQMTSSDVNGHGA